MSVIAKPYIATWNALDLGPTVDGFRVSYRNSGIDITNDLYGDTLVDVLYQGTVMSVSFIVEHWNEAAVQSLRWWMSSTWGQIPAAGASQYAAAKPLVLTCCDNSVEPSDITFYKTLPQAGQDFETLFSRQPRYMPFILDCFASDADGSPSGGLGLWDGSADCGAASFFEFSAAVP